MGPDSVADGTNSWSAALIGRECKVPVEFFLDSTDEQYVHLKPSKDMGKVNQAHYESI
jgi:hypothetical protein